jgi:hypothetical protein
MSLKLLLQSVCFVIVTSSLKCVAPEKKKDWALPALVLSETGFIICLKHKIQYN